MQLFSHQVLLAFVCVCVCFPFPGVMGGCMVPFVYQDYLVMHAYEFWSVVAAWLVYLAAILTYTFKWLNLWPSVWGYHEAFHTITIIGAVAAGVFNASICARLT